MSEDSEEALDLKEKVNQKRWAHRNFGVSIGAALALLTWYTLNPSIEFQQWPQTMALILIPGSFLFYIPSIAQSGGRFIHFCILAGALIPDLFSYLNNSQPTFLGTGPRWPLLWYGIAVVYFIPGALLGFLAFLSDQLLGE